MDFRRGRTSENPPVWKPHLSVPESRDTSTMTFGALTFFLSSASYAAVKVMPMLLFSSSTAYPHFPEKPRRAERVAELFVRTHEINVIRVVRSLPRYEKIFEAVGVPPCLNLS